MNKDIFTIVASSAIVILSRTSIKNTNINWLCWPTFRDSFVFRGLLDQEKGGEFSIKLIADETSSKQYYLENTNILVTEVHSEQGSFKVTDFAPRFHQYGVILNL